MKTIPLRGKKAAGRVALVDDEDFDLVSGYGWHLVDQSRPGRMHGPYAATNVRLPGTPHTVLMHKLITGWPQTDHINHDGLDNRRANLRPATHTQNRRNMRSHASGTSRYKGVSWDRVNRAWLAQITYGGRTRNLGRFPSEVQAAARYDAVARKEFGEYAYLNFPLTDPDVAGPADSAPATGP